MHCMPLFFGCRDKKAQAKAQGRRHDSSDDDDSDDMPEDDAAVEPVASDEEHDPFFQQDKDVFEDTFFTVSCGTEHLSIKIELRLGDVEVGQS